MSPSLQVQGEKRFAVITDMAKTYSGMVHCVAKRQTLLSFCSLLHSFHLVVSFPPAELLPAASFLRALSRLRNRTHSG